MQLRSIVIASRAVGFIALGHAADPTLAIRADGAPESNALSGDARLQSQSVAGGTGAFHLGHGSLLSSGRQK